MTVPATDSRAGPFSGSGVIVPLPFDFKVFAQEDVLVTRTDVDGFESTLAVGVDYTVTLNPDQDADPGGTVTPTVAPAVGELTTLTSGLDYEQPIDLVTGGKFRAQTVEDGFDRTTMLIKQLKEQSDRTLHLPISAEADVTLPVPESNALIGWNQDADALQNVDPATLATIVAFGTGAVDILSGNGSQTDFTLSSNPGALTNLHVSIGAADQRPGIDFTWPGGTTLHFVAPPPAGTDNILVQYMQALPQGAADAAATTWIDNGSTSRDVQTTLQRLTRDQISVREPRFGAVGDGTADDTAAVQAANATGSQVFFPAGTYLLQSDITFSKPPIVQPGAVLKPRSAVLTFSAGIAAGDHVIFDTTDDFVGNFQGNTSVVILGSVVKADWFCTKVQAPADILTISDQTNNLLKAYRAAVGNWVAVPSTSNYLCQYPQGAVELGIGYYRVDGTVTIGKQISSSFYRTTGFRLFGHGAGASFLVRTATAATAQVLSSFYTGELTHFEKFKVTVYNPSLVGAAQFQGAASAMVFLQGDSLQLNNIWVAGGQVSSGADANGIYRNGVGFQFSSCIDTYFHDLFVEYCVTGVAFSSSIVSGNNLELYHTLRQGVGLGEFESAYPATQATSSRVAIAGVQSRAAYNNGMVVLEQGTSGTMQITESCFDGFDAEAPAQGGVNFCVFAPSTSLMGGMSNGVIRNFTQAGWNINQTGVSLGRADQAFVVNNVMVQGIAADTNGAVFYNGSTGMFMNLIVDGLSVTDCNGLVMQSAQSGKAILNNVSLSRYVGKVDAGASRSLFVGLGADITLRDWYRNPSDTTALTQFAFVSSGNIYTDIQNLANATRLYSGAPTTSRMPSTAVFV